MKKDKVHHNDFIVDRLTNSIVNRISGDSFPTEVSLLTKTDLKEIQKRQGWLFNWKNELKSAGREVYKLTIVNNPTIIQGLTSLTVKNDHVLIHLIENAPFNRGKDKLYEGVPGNLVAYACRLSFQRGSAGFVSFHSKTNLVEHYIKTLGAYHFGGHLMVIDTDSATKLVDKYFKS
ncbi:MAG: hypothetical protein JWO32_435 [Bacteroidetes bacterium]|nr:hypothetical protein [Bacteroidota bacterium]